MAKPNIAPHSTGLDTRIYCDYSRLVRLQSQIGVFSLLPHLKAGSVLSGRHNSLFRGRGLNFEELRHYQLGDDIRNLDWKVTLRTGKPHVRSYTEEKDRNVIICVDQRSQMFFSSTTVMKSVIAAEIAAMCGWRVLKDGDRVGLVIASAEKIYHSKSQRSQHAFMAQLKLLANANQQLNVETINSDRVSFSLWLEQIKRMKLSQSTIVFMTDWRDCEERHLDQLKQLQIHNDVLAVLINDPLEQTLPRELAKSNWVVGDGQYQLSLDTTEKVDQASASMAARSYLTRQSLTRLMALKSLPFIELDTKGAHIAQFQRLVGRQ
ncbi:DUF58 domain-containing protein [Photobacterium sp. ZSDE20]|uniref:DUF58 domain-containing protein n=1 Tax=Photobacterium pectinilyticum TaxID=2906793 RepID=A0ABT1N2Q1_9GAMM|nr:DUF58 domain-containing protein [Photobacterium sp. ZSDE20]MCQ1058990.1 DUF58 domain-containing protein [Photobacterium sp. ZSDE20]MDD1823995.1 DUF58 domain-containing protein [Photobacterium sp. ZSDE20]